VEGAHLQAVAAVALRRLAAVHPHPSEEVKVEVELLPLPNHADRAGPLAPAVLQA
jgi:hypothetical protein